MPDSERRVTEYLANERTFLAGIKQITTVVELDKADERRAFGESLPAGLRLLSEGRTS
jgi:hypothetical protein